MHPMLNIAVRAARAAGNIIARNLGQNDQFEVTEKRKDDLVTDVDRECEQTITSILLKSYRDHAVLGEEGGVQGNKDSQFQWIIDPVDGTTNLIHGFCNSAISLALADDNRVIFGIVYNPFSNEIFIAKSGEGAFCNDRSIRVSSAESLSESLCSVGSNPSKRQCADEAFERMRRLYDRCHDIRRIGAASIELCYVACGRLDVYLEHGLKPWDFAAGKLIVEEAGGIVTDFNGNEPLLNENSSDIAASSGLIHSELLSVI